MSRSRASLVFALVAVVGLAGLVVAAARDRRPTAFSLNEPTDEPLAGTNAGQVACEGPIEVQKAFSGIRFIAGTDAAPGARVTISIVAHDRAVLATRALRLTRTRQPTVLSFARVIRAGQTISICMHNHGPQFTAFFGWLHLTPSLWLTIDGRRVDQEAAFVFLRPRPPSLLSLIPTMFRRAALFRPGWTGVWTFWALGIGLLLSFGLVGWALAKVAAEDSLQ